jgi:hypothetical protein
MNSTKSTPRMSSGQPVQSSIDWHSRSSPYTPPAEPFTMLPAVHRRLAVKDPRGLLSLIADLIYDKPRALKEGPEGAFVDETDEQLAERCGVSVATIERWLRTLRESNAVECPRPYGKRRIYPTKGQGKSTVPAHIREREASKMRGAPLKNEGRSPQKRGGEDPAPTMRQRAELIPRMEESKNASAAIFLTSEPETQASNQDILTFPVDRVSAQLEADCVREVKATEEALSRIAPVPAACGPALDAMPAAGPAPVQDVDPQAWGETWRAMAGGAVRPVAEPRAIGLQADGTWIRAVDGGVSTFRPTGQLAGSSRPAVKAAAPLPPALEAIGPGAGQEVLKAGAIWLGQEVGEPGKPGLWLKYCESYQTGAISPEALSGALLESRKPWVEKRGAVFQSEVKKRCGFSVEKAVRS